ncbi:MAG: NADH-quinone oxidoreductase subunit C [Endomicrobiales bacterium]
MKDIEKNYNHVTRQYNDEVYIDVPSSDFKAACLDLHTRLKSPVMTMFAIDDRPRAGSFMIVCGFLSVEDRQWVFVRQTVPPEKPSFDSLARDIYSACLFERQILESFGIMPVNNPDTRRLHLHDEIWPDNSFPLRKDFTIAPEVGKRTDKNYVFRKIEGEGICEVAVGPVHAGVIGSGHFRFSVAGEPVISLEPRLGFTHRGVEKLFEGKTPEEAMKLSSNISGKSAVAHRMAFCRAIEKICALNVSLDAQYSRCVFLELERLYNHIGTIGALALDAAFSFPASYAALMKESILSVNEQLTGSRYLKDAIVIGGVAELVGIHQYEPVRELLSCLEQDMETLREMLFSNGSFLDRIETTGVLSRRIAEDVGIVGLVARSSGLGWDLRAVFPDQYAGLSIKPAYQSAGDVAARLIARFDECKSSMDSIKQCLEKMDGAGTKLNPVFIPQAGNALGVVEGARGPVLYWVRTHADGSIDRCAITDPSFHNWIGLPYVMPGNIIPDFPLCNKSFDLSYAGNDL